MEKNKYKILILVLFSTLIILSAGLVSAYPNPATVNLGEAGNFAVLSKVAISDTSPTATVITGDIGVSPLPPTSITGLACSEVVGTIHVVSPGGATLACQTVDPAYLTPTILEMEAAYTDALSRASNAGLPGSLGGLTLTPGVYTTAGGVLIPTDVTLDCTSTGPSGVFIFRIAGTLDLSANTNVNLIGGCQSANIFWAVAGTTSIGGGVGTESTFEGTVLGGPATSEIAVVTGSTINGRLLGQKGIALDQNIITLPVAIVADITPPVITLLGTNPINETQNTPYIDAGATAFDNIDGDITINILTNNNVNISLVGTYSVNYTVSDAAGNIATVTRTVNVVIPSLQPGLCFFGDSNGDCFITSVDVYQAKISSMLRTADYSGITPYGLDSSVQDVNGDGIISISDYNLIKDMVSLKTDGITGIPTAITSTSVPTTLDISSGSSNLIVKVTDIDGTPRAGIGVRFTIDPSSTATANLGGRNPSNWNNYIISDDVFELTNKLVNIAQDGEAQIAITPLTTGNLIINMVIPASPNKGLMNDITNSITINVVSVGGTITNTAPTEPTFTMVSGSTTSYTNQLIKFTVSSTDTDPLVYSVTGLPTGAAFVGQTFEWTPPTSAKTGSSTLYTILFKATDSNGASAEKGINIILVNSIPVIQDITNITIDENGLVSVTPVVTNDDNDALTYTYSSPLDSTGNWQTDFNSAGIYTVTVTVSDGISGDSKTFNINVNDFTQNNDNQGANSNNGGGGHSYTNLTTPTIFVTPIKTSGIIPAVQAQPEQNINPEEQNTPAVNSASNQVTGFSVVDLAKQNPITTGIISIIVLGLLGYGIYYFRK